MTAETSREPQGLSVLYFFRLGKKPSAPPSSLFFSLLVSDSGQDPCSVYGRVP